MGSVSLKIGDGTARFRRASLCSSALNIVMLASVVFTNLFALFAFTRPAPPPPSSGAAGGFQPLELHQHRLISDQVDLILREIDDSQRRLSRIERDILGYDTFDASRPGTPPELKLFLARHPLPLGRDSRTGITEMLSSVGHSCASSSRDLLAKYATYNRGEECPTDELGLIDKLLARGCEPLPRRRCLSRPAPKLGLLPFPLSLWAPVSDKISGASWKAAFDKLMWVKARGKTDFLIDDVLELPAGAGQIRVGLDVGGGVGDFAARMAEKGVTVVTSTVNSGGKPISEVVAARGLFPLHFTSGQRFPFYDSVFDLVHTIAGLSEGAAAAAVAEDWQERLEFLMFDIDRVLRPGGLFWLDNYQCLDDKRKSALTALIEKFGYKKLKWVVGEKADTAGNGKPKVYLSAVLQKPARV